MGKPCHIFQWQNYQKLETNDKHGEYPVSSSTHSGNDENLFYL